MVFTRKHTHILLGAVAISIIAIWLGVQPSNNRDWALDQAILPYAEVSDNLVTIYNVRNFTYASTTSYTPAYYNKTYDLNQITSVDYIVSPFSDWEGSAHTFLSFGFEEDIYVSISIEIRKEKGESFSPLKGLFKQYEIMYVVGDEQDLVKLRTNYRKDQVYMYPIKISKEKSRELFLSMIQKVNRLKETPQFYNTLTSTCTTEIAKHVNLISPKKIPFSYKVLFPGYSDRLVYDLGLIDTDLPFEEIRTRFNINQKALLYAGSPDFSVKIRE